MYLLHIAVLGLVFAAHAADQVSKGFSKRIIVFKRIIHCDDQGLGTWTASINLMKSGRTYLMNGNITWPLDINESLKVRVTASLFKDGQFHDGYLDLMIDGCQQFEYLSNDFLKALFATTDIKTNQCPYPKGTYTYKNFQMESNPIMPDSVPNGLYKLSMYVIDDKENLMGCATSFVDINQEKRKTTD